MIGRYGHFWLYIHILMERAYGKAHCQHLIFNLCIVLFNLTDFKLNLLAVEFDTLGTCS